MSCSSTDSLSPEPLPWAIQVPEQARMTGSTAVTRDVVLEVQTKLSNMGYDVGTPDGIAGKKTENAVRMFQQSHGLQVNGQMNPATIQAIRSAQ